MRVHIVMHESFEAPAAIESWVRERGFAPSFTRLYAGDKLPSGDSFEFLVVMGGPQSPATTRAECPHFDSAEEVTFIRRAIEAGKLVLGVCLGGQMIGEALGARFDHSPNREIGVFPISLTDEGKSDPIFRSFPATFPVGHWHGDMPGLTPQSSVLARSDGCPRQIVRYTPSVYGFQCHFEFTPAAIDGMIENSVDELRAHAGLPYVQPPEELRAHDYTGMNRLLFIFLDALTALHR